MPLFFPTPFSSFLLLNADSGGNASGLPAPGPDGGTAQSTAAVSPPSPAATPDANAADAVQARIDAAVAEAKAEWQRGVDADKKAAADKAAAEQGKFKELYEGLQPQHEAVSAELTALRTAYESTLTPRIEKLPDSLRARVNALPLSERAGMLADLETALGSATPVATATAPATPAPQTGGSDSFLKQRYAQRKQRKAARAN